MEISFELKEFMIILASENGESAKICFTSFITFTPAIWSQKNSRTVKKILL